MVKQRSTKQTHKLKIAEHKSGIWGGTKQYLRWIHAVDLPEVTWPALTGSDITGSHVTRRGPPRNRSRAHVQPVHFVHGYRTWPNVTWSRMGFHWVRTCATESCAISTRMSSPEFFLYKPLECSLWRPCLSLASPGYLPLLFSYNISIMVFGYGV